MKAKRWVYFTSGINICKDSTGTEWVGCPGFEAARSERRWGERPATQEFVDNEELLEGLICVTEITLGHLNEAGTGRKEGNTLGAGKWLGGHWCWAKAGRICGVPLALFLHCSCAGLHVWDGYFIPDHLFWRPCEWFSCKELTCGSCFAWDACLPASLQWQGPVPSHQLSWPFHVIYSA